MSTILKLENNLISLRLADDFSAQITDKANYAEWIMRPTCYQEIGALSDDAVWNRQERCYMDRYPAFFKAEPAGDALRVTVLDPLRQARGSFACRITLEEGWLRFALENIDDSLPSLIFPPYIESESLVIPRGMGHWFKKPIPESAFIMPASGWGMRWFGGLRKDNGWIAIVDEGYADAGVYLSQLTACAGWQKTMRQWAPRRELRIGFTNGAYVGLAKKFRAYAQQNHLFKSLRQKIEEIPSVGNLIGGRCLNFFQAYTEHKENPRLWMSPVPPEAEARDGQVQALIPHRHVLQVIREARELGMKRGYFNLRGTFKGGYDEYHPDNWPAEPVLGPESELLEIFAEKDPFVAMLHDNYQDTYTRTSVFPDSVQQTPDGRLKAGGTWHGGRCYLMNPREAHRYMRRNWEYFKKFHPRGAFLDTVGGAHFQEDYHPAHRLTRTEDGQAKLEILKFHKEKGMVVGTELNADYCVEWVDFFENRHRRAPWESIPLWHLVYHDAVVNLRYGSGTNDFEAANDLEDILWGCAKMWPVGNLDNWHQRRGEFQASLPVDAWHARVGTDEMTSHRYLTEDGLLEQTEFSSGVAVMVNFAYEPHTHGGKTIPARSYVICD